MFSPMKIIRNTWIHISILLLYTFSGCDGFFNNYHSDFDFIREGSHTFQLYDFYSMERLLGIQSRYSRDTVKIFDEAGRIYFGGPVDLDGRIYFELLTLDDYKVLNQLIVRELYLYLKHDDIDTLRYEFEMRNNDCGNQVYNYTKLTYNDSIYIDEYNHRFRSITLYKK
jgi:hypothetical protein